MGPQTHNCLEIPVTWHIPSLSAPGFAGGVGKHNSFGTEKYPRVDGSISQLMKDSAHL